MTSEIRCVWPARALLGEGPLWHRGRLYWVDVKKPAVHCFDPAAETRQSWPMPEPIGCIAPRRAGGFVAGMKSGFAFIDLVGGAIERIGNPEPEYPDILKDSFPPISPPPKHRIFLRLFLYHLL